MTTSQGIDKYIVDDMEVARQDRSSYPRPLNIIEGPLMKVSCSPSSGFELHLNIIILARYLIIIN